MTLVQSKKKPTGEKSNWLLREKTKRTFIFSAISCSSIALNINKRAKQTNRRQRLGDIVGKVATMVESLISVTELPQGTRRATG